VRRYDRSPPGCPARWPGAKLGETDSQRGSHEPQVAEQDEEEPGTEVQAHGSAGAGTVTGEQEPEREGSPRQEHGQAGQGEEGERIGGANEEEHDGTRPEADENGGRQRCSHAQRLGQKEGRSADRLRQPELERAPLPVSRDSQRPQRDPHQGDEQEHEVDETGGCTPEAADRAGSAGQGNEQRQSETQDKERERIGDEPAVAERIAELFLGQDDERLTTHRRPPSGSRGRGYRRGQAGRKARLCDPE